MNASSASVPPEVDEFSLAGLDSLPSRLVAAPRVALSPVHFECRVSQIVQLQSALGEAVNTWLVLGEVVAVRPLSGSTTRPCCRAACTTRQRPSPSCEAAEQQIIFRLAKSSSFA